LFGGQLAALRESQVTIRHVILAYTLKMFFKKEKKKKYNLGFGYSLYRICVLDAEYIQMLSLPEFRCIISRLFLTSDQSFITIIDVGSPVKHAVHPLPAKHQPVLLLRYIICAFHTVQSGTYSYNSGSKISIYTPLIVYNLPRNSVGRKWFK
jgi:hypothetical protein